MDRVRGQFSGGEHHACLLGGVDQMAPHPDLGQIESRLTPPELSVSTASGETQSC